jgi:hypothetical protein
MELANNEEKKQTETKNNKKKMKYLPQNWGTTQGTEDLRKKRERKNGITKQRRKEI